MKIIKNKKRKSNVFYQNVQCVIVENLNFLKSKKLHGCLVVHE